MIRLFVVLAFFVSGASSLMLEVVWSKALGRVLGNTLEAITTVVAAYMFGLALGAAIAGRAERLQRRPVLAYGVFEVGIGLFALGSLALIHALDGPLGQAYAAFGFASPVYVTLRFLATFGLLLVPTTMMGATLPVLVAWGTQRADLGRVLGTLYAINTAGAVAGTLVAGFGLLPAIGLSRTALTAGALSISVGTLMALASRALPPADPAAHAPAAAPRARARPQAPAPSAAYRPRLMLALFALSGAVSLSAQIAWARVGAILLGSSVYSFTLVLATFLVGIAAGSAIIVPVLAHRGSTWRLFAVLQWIAAAGILYCSIRIVDAPWNLLENVVAAQGRVGWLWIRESLLLAGFMLPACLAFGALFPVATRLSAFDGDTPAHTTGRAYGWNTLGTVSGSLLTGFVIVQAVGMHATLVGAAGLALVLGGVAWFLAPRRARKASAIPEGAPVARLAVPAAVLAAFAAAAIFAPPWNRGLMAIGVFRPLIATMAQRTFSPAEARVALRQQMAEEELLSFHEGRQATVTVHRTKGANPIVAIRVNGKTDASTGLDMTTQILAGELPMFWAPDSARVLVVGFGSGVTVGSALAQPLRTLDLIEIEPGVLAANRFFEPYNRAPLSDPRTRVHLEDGRTFITYAPRAYDVIISEPSNPWLAGVNNLFTVDFYRRVRGRLAPGGVFCQWMQFYEMSGTTLASLLRTMHEVFPRAQVFLSNRDLLLVATLDGRPLDLEQVRRRLERPAVREDLARANVASAAGIAALHQGSLDDIVQRLQPAPLNTDDRPFVEYRAPVDFYTVQPADQPFSEQTMREADPLDDLDTWLAGAQPVPFGVAVARALMERGNLAGAGRWLEAVNRRDPTLARSLTDELQETARARDRELGLARARLALEQNDPETARILLDGLLAQSPRDPTLRIERARVYMRQDSLDAAARLLEASLTGAGPDDQYQAYCNLGILAMRRHQPEKGLDYFGQAIRARPDQSGGYVYRAEALAGMGRRNEALLVLTEGERAVTDKAAIHAAQEKINRMGASL